jgi:ubiquinone/menaquinone biosynthesis C-methylase UbiE
MRLALSPFGGENKARIKFLDFAQLQKAGKVVEICAGTISLTVILADTIGAGGAVIGIDLSA